MEVSRDKMPIYAIFITKVENRTIGNFTISRHNKYLNFYRSVNIWRVILGNFLNIRLPNHDKSRERIESERYIPLRNLANVMESIAWVVVTDALRTHSSTQEKHVLIGVAGGLGAGGVPVGLHPAPVHGHPAQP
jgi:hypothetical protein